MKKFLSLLAISALMFAGCQEDLENGLNGADKEGVVRISLKAPEAMGTTRAAGYTNSAAGGITNVDWTKYDLRYQVAVYDKDGNNQVVSPIVKTVQGSYAGIDFEVRLVNGREYRFVAWADFVAKGTTTDLHYNTSDLAAISCMDAADKQLNDESRDAYFVTKNQTVDASAGVSLTLRRPFAKVRVVTTDWDENGTYMPDNFKVTYYGCQRFNSLNAITGEPAGAMLDEAPSEFYTAKLESKTEKDYSEGYEAESPKNRTLIVDYLLAPSAQTPIHFKFEALDGTQNVSTYDFATEIPIRRNFLTTLVGNLLTENTKVTVECDENFEDEIQIMDSWWDPKAFGEMKEPMIETNAQGKPVYHVKTIGELAWLSENDRYAETPWFKKVKFVVLDNDLDLNGVNWKPMAVWEPEAPATFDGNGHTIYNLRINSFNGKTQSGLGLFGDIKNRGWITVNIKNLTLENVTFNHAGAWSGALAGNLYGHIENCHVKHVFIHAGDYDNYVWNLRIGGMVGFHNTGSMKDCTAEDIQIKGLHLVGGISGATCSEGQITYENCHVKNVELWASTLAKTEANQIGSIVGASVSYQLTLKNCSAQDCTYKVGPYNTENGTPYILHDGDEKPENEYGPTNHLYGRGPVTVINE